MKVKCIQNYNDLQLDRRVKVGEVFEVKKDRADALIKAKVVTTTTTEKVARANSKKGDA